MAISQSSKRPPAKTAPILSSQNGPHTLQVLIVFTGPTYCIVHLNYVCVITMIQAVINGGSAVNRHYGSFSLCQSHFVLSPLSGNL